jgi:hypothetical protein
LISTGNAAQWWDESAKRFRLIVGYPGEGGLKSRVPYRVDDAGSFVPADNAAVVVTSAQGVFHRASPVTEWTAGPDSNTQQRSFDAKERL